MVLGSDGTNAYYFGTISSRSDGRDKADIRDTALGLDFIAALRPVDYRWDYRDAYRPPMPAAPGPTASDAERAAHAEAMARWREASKLANLVHDGSKKRTRFHHGLIAQEVASVLSERGIDFGGFQHHAVNGGDDVMTLGYTEFIAPLIRSVQELLGAVKALETGDRERGTELEKVRAAHDALEARLAALEQGGGDMR